MFLFPYPADPRLVGASRGLLLLMLASTFQRTVPDAPFITSCLPVENGCKITAFFVTGKLFFTFFSKIFIIADYQRVANPFFCVEPHPRPLSVAERGDFGAGDGAKEQPRATLPLYSSSLRRGGISEPELGAIPSSPWRRGAGGEVKSAPKKRDGASAVSTGNPIIYRYYSFTSSAGVSAGAASLPASALGADFLERRVLLALAGALASVV